MSTQAQAVVNDPTASTPRHPVAPLTASEIDGVREILTKAGLVGSSTRFSYVLLREPEKSEVLAFEAAMASGEVAAVPAREVGALLTDLEARTLIDTITDLTGGSVTYQRVVDPALEGFAPVFEEEYSAVDTLLKHNADWVAAVSRRGITDLSTVRTVALSAGVFGYADEVGRRMVRVLAFQQNYPTDSVWAHPIDGVVAHVDLDSHQVLRVVETPITHIPVESGDYLDASVRGPERTDLKPISITQPEGVSFTLDDGVLSWQNWKVRLGFNGREGLTLHQLSYLDGESERPVLYRASISEMVVNYGDPSPTHAWQNYFDVGEYQFGRLANSLELGCDCLGEITYVDAVVVDDHGQPRTISNAICVHEEDYGILWKHTDPFSGTRETRRQRRLVVSFFVTVGNYDYGFYWYLYLDGTIELESKATGIVFTSGHDGTTEYATEIAPGLGAPIHQHLFCARLDMTVDGTRNRIEEIDVTRVPVSDTNPWGNAFTRIHNRLLTEQGACRDTASDRGRVWAIRSAERTNRVGNPTGYVLYPVGGPTLLTADDSSSRRRAGFTAHSLWVTRYHRDELWAAGYLVNQHPGGAGLPSYVCNDRDINDTDIVVWHTFGLTHFPRLEDWPIMPVDHIGFRLKPDGFFDRNPTLDVPQALNRCHADSPSISDDCR